VYGITTGFGKFARTVIDCDKLEYVSYNLQYPLHNIDLSVTQQQIVEGDVIDA
jgi:histidine ammonia-lyase